MSAAPSLISVGIEIQDGEFPDLRRFETHSLTRVPCCGEFVVGLREDADGQVCERKPLRVVGVAHLLKPDEHGHHAHLYCVEMVTPEPDGT